MRRRWIVLLPIMMGTFLISFLDRTNISFAIPFMQADLKLDPAVLGFSSGVLFLGYAITQALGGWIADRGHVKTLIAVLMITWGLCAIVQGFITSASQLVIVRFLLGLAEGGIFPAFLTIVRAWFTEQERARANGFWQLCYPIAAAVSGPLAGYILQYGSWRTLFIIEGVFPLVWVLVWLWGIQETPERANWLSVPERDALTRHLGTPSQQSVTPPESLRAALLSPTAILLFAVMLFWNVGFLGFVIWLPSVIRQSSAHLSAEAIGWYGSLPFVAAVISLLVLSYGADRTMNRRGFSFWPLLVAAGMLFLGAATYGQVSLGVAMILLTVAACGIYGVYPVVWSIATECAPPGVTGLFTGVVNIGGVLGAFLGPYLVGYARSISDTFASGLITMGLCLVVAALCVFVASSLVRHRTIAGVPDRAVPR